MFRKDREENEFIDKVVHINRVAKVVKGGRRFSFSAIVVVGDGDGTVGYVLEKPGKSRRPFGKALKRRKRICLRWH